MSIEHISYSSGAQRGMPPMTQVKKRDSSTAALDVVKMRNAVTRAAQGFEHEVSIDAIMQEALRNMYDQVTTQEIESALILASAAFIEQDPAYDHVATRLLLQKIYKEVFGGSVTNVTLLQEYQTAFVRSLEIGVRDGILNPDLLTYDLGYLARSLRIERDHKLNYLGLQTLYERYFLKNNKKRFELPQLFWMRVAMGLALNEANKEERAVQFYEVLSTLRYVSSTPTLFHAGYKVSQLSSCYLSTANDDLGHIFKVIGDNAQLSKYAGGIGNDWTNIRGTGSFINSIHATSQGVIPYLRIVNDVVVAITRSGIRRGGTCSYLESWHYDFEDFLDLRRNTGDERRRTHDMNTASWIPDLMIKRVEQDGEWTLFSPNEVPDLHDAYGADFERRYQAYEEKARAGQIKLFKVVSAQKLWRKMISRLFETGHPWITFKDPCNVRSPQDHAGVVHSSNLCTEITLNTSDSETAVCNLGSINLGEHIVNGVLDEELLARSIDTAVRMLDNVIDLNFYPTVEARDSNARHRPVGLGMMGFQDALFKLDIPFSSQEALTFADKTGEVFSYYAILASSRLAKERGVYQSYKGSKWDRNIFPLDTLTMLEKERGVKIKASRTTSMDWAPVREHVQQWGMRNSNVMAVAPTATIANIAGCYPSIEPMYKNIYVKSNISGEFTIVNKYLVKDLKQLGLWNQEMLEQLKYYDGEISQIKTIPDRLKEKYKGAFELDPVWLIAITAERGKWIDQSQSHNVFYKGVSGKDLDRIYREAWHWGLKTTYYLRTLGATQIEKATLDASKYGFTQKREYKEVETSNVSEYAQASTAADYQLKNLNEFDASVYNNANASCNPFGGECESCQ